MCSESVTATLQPLFEDCCVAPFIPLAHQVGLERRSEEQIISRVGVENPLLSFPTSSCSSLFTV